MHLLVYGKSTPIRQKPQIWSNKTWDRTKIECNHPDSRTRYTLEIVLNCTLTATLHKIPGTLPIFADNFSTFDVYLEAK